MRDRRVLFAGVTLVLALSASFAAVATAAPGAGRLGTVTQTGTRVTAGAVGDIGYRYVAGPRRIRGDVRLNEPAGWTRAQRTSPRAPGFVTVGRGNCRSVTLRGIDRLPGGATRLRLSVDCRAGRSFRVVLRKVTAPARAGSYPWSFRLRAAGAAAFSTVPGSAPARVTAAGTSPAKTPTPTPTPEPAPSSLEFTSGIPDGYRPVSWASFVPIVVQVLDQYGDPIDADVPVALGVDDNCPHAGITGSTTVEALDGAATFEGIIPTARCTAFRLVATSPGLTRAVSADFAVDGGWAPVLPRAPVFERTLVELTDGRVLETGGFEASSGMQVTTTRLFDPATSGYATAADAPTARESGIGVLLADGRVLVTGGRVSVQTEWSSHLEPAVSTDLYDPFDDSWTQAAAVPDGLRVTPRDALTLEDGRVLVFGGEDELPVAYDPATDSWASAAGGAGAAFVPITTPGASHTLLPDGSVLVVGPTAASRDSVQLFDPATDDWAAAAPIPVARAGQATVVLPDGTVMLVAGKTVPVSGPVTGPGEDPDHVAIYHPADDSWSSLATPQPIGGSGRRAAVLAAGEVLVAGIADDTGLPSEHTWLYSPGSGWMPAGTYIGYDPLLLPAPDGSLLALSGTGRFARFS